MGLKSQFEKNIQLPTYEYSLHSCGDISHDAPKINRNIQSTYGVGIVHAQSNHSVSVIN